MTTDFDTERLEIVARQEERAARKMSRDKHNLELLDAEKIQKAYSNVRSTLIEGMMARRTKSANNQLDSEYIEWYGTEKDKHKCAVSCFKDDMDSMDIRYTDTDRSGIDFISPRGDECVIHGLGGNADGFVIHDTIDNLKGDVFIYINNLAQRKHVVSIMSRKTILSNCRNRGSDPQTMIPLAIMMENVDNYNILTGGTP